MTTILFDSTRVNPARKPFGAGIFPARPARFVPSDEDREWAGYELNKNCTDYEVILPARDWDQEAGESEAIDRMSAGIPLF